MTRWLVLALLLSLAAGCASTSVEPLTNETTRSALNAKERELWGTAEKLEQLIATHVEPIESQEQVEQYLHEVLARVVPDFNNPQMPIRVRLLPDPSPNAFVLANGVVYVNTGLLALLENEAQLATVLGHEFCHFRNRHSYRERIKQDNEELKAAILGGALGALAGDPSATQSVAQLWTISSVSGFSRDLEAEADRASLIAVTRAQYEPQEAIKAFQQMQTVSDLEDQDEEQRFATHPKLTDRIAGYHSALQEPEVQQYATGHTVAAERYNEKLFQAIVYNARLNLDEGNYGFARDNIARCLNLKPGCAEAHFLNGQLWRCAPSDDADIWQNALDAYGRAVSADPNMADPYREIGLLQRRLGQTDEARQSLTTYLALSDDAPDSPLVKHYLHHLDDAKTVNPLHRPPRVDESNFKEKVKKIGLIPTVIATEVVDPDERCEEFETLLADRLKESGFTVIPASEYTETYESLKEVMGPVFDPSTGERLEDKHEVLEDFARREYCAIHRPDAMAYSVIGVVEAKWNMNRASWHGVTESSTGKEGFWAEMMAPSAHGTMGALSFHLVIANLHDEAFLMGIGGIQLCSRLSGSSFVEVPVYELLTDSQKNARSVDIACRALRERD